MKKMLALVAVSSLLILFGCGKTPITTPTNGDISYTSQTYENKEHQFIIHFPDTREYQENIYGTHVTIFTPLGKKDTLRENVGIIKEDLDHMYSLEDYYTLTKKKLETSIPNFVEVSKESIFANGREGYKLIYQGSQGDFNLQWQQNYFIKDKAVYIITYTATPKSFDDFAQIVDEMVATFEIQ